MENQQRYEQRHGPPPPPEPKPIRMLLRPKDVEPDPTLVAPPVPPAKYGADAVADERAKAFQQDLPALRAQLRALGPMGQQLQQLAIKHAASARHCGRGIQVHE